MPAEIVTGRFCADYFSVFDVPGSKGAMWHVVMNGTEASCDCPAFRYFKGDPWDRTCKHITYVWDHACLWNEQWCDGKADDLEPAESTGYPRIPGATCPACGGPVCPVKIAV